MQSSDIANIESSKKDDISDLKIALYEKWLQLCPDASWEDVTTALETARENRLAEQIQQKTHFITAKPSLEQLNKHLSKLVNWQTFGPSLPGIDQSDIRQIEEAINNTADKKIALYKRWLQAYSAATWENVINALETAEETKIAQEIQQRIQKSKLTEPSNIQVRRLSADNCQDEIEVSEDLVEELKELEESFDKLTEEVKNETIDAVASGRKTMRSIVSYVEEQRAFSIKIQSQVKSSDQLFKAIRPCYNFLNCILLIRLATYLSEAIAQKAHTYNDTLTMFKKSTLVKEFAKILKSLRSDMRLSHTRMVKIRVENAWGNQEVWLVEKLLETLFPVKHPGELLWYEVTAGSVIMCFVTSDYMLLPLIVSCTEKVEFMRLLGIISLTIGRIYVPVKNKEEEMFSFENSLIRATLSDNNTAVRFLLQHTHVDVNVQNTQETVFDSSSSHALFIQEETSFFCSRVTDLENELLQLEKEDPKPAIKAIFERLRLGKPSILNAHLLQSLLKHSLVPEEYSFINNVCRGYEFLKTFTKVSDLKHFLNPSDSCTIPNSLSVLSVSLYSAWKKCLIFVVENALKLIFTVALYNELLWFKAEDAADQITISFLVRKTIPPEIIKLFQKDILARLLGIASIHIDSTILLPECNDNEGNYTFEQALRQAQWENYETHTLLWFITAQPINVHCDENHNFKFNPNKLSTPLMIACCNDNTELVELLLRYNADPNVKDSMAWTALEYSIRNKNIFKMIFNICTNDSDTVERIFITACKIENPTALRLIMEKYSVITDNTLQKISLHTVSEYGNTTIVKKLLKLGIDPNIQCDDFGDTPLIKASSHGRLPVVEVLLKSHADPNTANFKKLTPLHQACRNGYIAIAEKLLKNHVDTDILDIDGVTPLLYACMNGHPTVVKALLKAQADPNITDNQGTTALLGASLNGHENIVELLLEANVDPNISDNKGHTPLHAAAALKFLVILEMLIQAKAELNLPNYNGDTPLHIASLKGNVEVVKQLVKAGANQDLQNKNGHTPLMIADNHGHSSIMEILTSTKDEPNA